MSLTGAQDFSGKSVEEAIAEGLRKLGLRSDEVTIETINKGSRGLFGLGSEPAVVRITPIGHAAKPDAAGHTAMPAESDAGPVYFAPPYFPGDKPLAATAGQAAQESAVDMVAEGAPAAAPAEPGEATASAPQGSSVPDESPARAEAPESDDEIAGLASAMLDNIVSLMGFEAQVQADWRDADDITEERHLLLSVRGRDISALIGRRGETLENLQYLLRLMVNQRLHRWLNIIVDVEEYRAKRVEHLSHLSRRMADQVAETGRAFALEPMPPNERRIVHLALRDDTRIFTESTGEGERRKVNIFPRK